MNYRAYHTVVCPTPLPKTLPFRKKAIVMAEGIGVSTPDNLGCQYGKYGNCLYGKYGKHGRRTSVQPSQKKPLIGTMPGWEPPRENWRGRGTPIDAVPSGLL